MTTKPEAKMATVEDAQRIMALYHKDVPLTIKLPDGTRLAVTGFMMEHQLGVLDTVTLTLQTSKNPAGDHVEPLKV